MKHLLNVKKVLLRFGLGMVLLGVSLLSVPELSDTVKASSKNIPLTGTPGSPVLIQGTAKLFVGTSCTNNGLEDTENFIFTILPGDTLNQTINLINGYHPHRCADAR